MAANDEYIIYSKDNCSYCQQAKNLLLMRGKNFKVLKLGEDYTIEEFLEWFPDQKTFPMIVLKIDDPYNTTNKETVTYKLGGFEELREFLG